VKRLDELEEEGPMANGEIILKLIKTIRTQCVALKTLYFDEEICSCCEDNFEVKKEALGQTEKDWGKDTADVNSGGDK